MDEEMDEPPPQGEETASAAEFDAFLDDLFGDQPDQQEEGIQTPDGGTEVIESADGSQQVEEGAQGKGQ